MEINNCIYIQYIGIVPVVEGLQEPASTVHLHLDGATQHPSGANNCRAGLDRAMPARAIQYGCKPR